RRAATGRRDGRAHRDGAAARRPCRGPRGCRCRAARRGDGIRHDADHAGRGTLVFAGVLASGPVTAPFLITLAGAPFGRSGRLATASAVRNPRRTATTMASLLVGVT